MTKRVLILTAACVLMLGVPAWQAQNSPAQDILPQVEQQPMQEQQMQEPMAQPPMAQEPTVREPLTPEHEMQAEESETGTPEHSPERVAQAQHHTTANGESAESEEATRNDSDKNKPVADAALTNPVLWHNPGHISSKDLFWGHGGQQRRPKPPFTFVREDMQGSSPKFDCRDANGRKWRVKLGVEARPEVVASRLLWAVGYFVNDDYVLPNAEVSGLKMHRKSNQRRGTTVIDARFARKPEGREKIGTWRWQDNPFFGTREFNGLRVMMAVMNNWDLKDNNNAVQEARDHHHQFFLVSDLGASFGANAVDAPASPNKGNPQKFERSRFITRNDGVVVDFATPAAPKGMLVKVPLYGAIGYIQRSQLDWIGHNISVPDAHWIGTLLGQLSHRQLVDAFRAGNFPPSEVDRYVTVVENRIRELQGL